MDSKVKFGAACAASVGCLAIAAFAPGWAIPLVGVMGCFWFGLLASELS